MKDLLTFLVKSIVENEDAVVIEENEGENAFIYKIKVAPEDMGRVIGKQGRIAQSIRSIAKAATPRDRKKTIVDIV
ncbi:MAG: KH domain-containing protein [Clostridia bacterium]|nr:KH domain-containing protein [Clostridia bacterium]MBQ7951211.1 KH domain-containing protein [Clostridia bacterium]